MCVSSRWIERALPSAGRKHHLGRPAVRAAERSGNGTPPLSAGRPCRSLFGTAEPRRMEAALIIHVWKATGQQRNAPRRFWVSTQGPLPEWRRDLKSACLQSSAGKLASLETNATPARYFERRESPFQPSKITPQCSPDDSMSANSGLASRAVYVCGVAAT